MYIFTIGLNVSGATNITPFATGGAISGVSGDNNLIRVADKSRKYSK